MLAEDAIITKQCVAICFEGLCASVSLATFGVESDVNCDKFLLRANFIEALLSFKKATNNAVTILIYTFLSEDKLKRILEP